MRSNLKEEIASALPRNDDVATMTKEEILRDASSYIEKFKGKVFVIKYGGSLLDDKQISDSILDDIVCFHQYGIKVILVHGGGAEISRLMKEKGKESKFVMGLRVTDKETANIVDEALTNINRNLVARIGAKNVKAESLVSKEKLTIKGKRKFGSDLLDFVGEVASVDAGYIKEALDKDAIPVVSPVAMDNNSNIYNINADLAAAEIAAAISAEKLILLTDIKGVMAKKDDESSLISTLKKKEAHDLINRGVIDSGMIPKVEAGILALDKGVHKVHIISGSIKHSLLTEVFTDKGIGTEIVR